MMTTQTTCEELNGRHVASIVYVPLGRMFLALLRVVEFRFLSSRSLLIRHQSTRDLHELNLTPIELDAHTLAAPINRSTFVCFRLLVATSTVETIDRWQKGDQQWLIS